MTPPSFPSRCLCQMGNSACFSHMPIVSINLTMVYLTSPTQKFFHFCSGTSKIQVMNARTVQALGVEHSLVSMYAAWVEPLGHSCWQISLTSLTHPTSDDIQWENGPFSMGKWWGQTQIEVGQNMSKPLKWLPEVDTFGGLRSVEVYWLVFMRRSLANCCGPQPTLAKLANGWSSVGGLVPKGLQMWA